jgi:hypothetical protein
MLRHLPYVLLRRTGTPAGALNPPPREAAASVRVRKRRPDLRRAIANVPSVISARARSHAFCDPSRDRSLGRRSRELHSRFGPRKRCRRERAREGSEHAGDCPPCDMGRGPEAKVPPAIPAREIPSFEYRGHPVSSPEACPD